MGPPPPVEAIAKEARGEVVQVIQELRSGVEWSGVEWSGVEWSGVEWSGVTHHLARVGHGEVPSEGQGQTAPEENHHDDGHWQPNLP